MHNNIAVLFPGQSSQYTGMGRELYSQYPIARQIFDMSSDIVHFDVAEACFYGDSERQKAPSVLLPMLLTIGYAAYQVLQKELPFQPSYMAGHSAGQFTAMACSGLLAFEDALKLVQYRGELMKEQQEQYSMMAVFDVPIEQLADAIATANNRNGNTIGISNYNSKSQIVISGSIKDLNRLAGILAEKGFKTTMLPVSHAFHSMHMNDMALMFKRYLIDSEFSCHKPVCPIIMNTTAQPFEEGSNLPDLLYEHTIKPVYWMQTIDYIKSHSTSILIDMGPNHILQAFDRGQSELQFLCFDPYIIEDFQKQWDSLSEMAKKQRINFIIKCLTTAVCTQNLNDDDDEYDKYVIVPYRKVENMLDEIEKSSLDSTVDQLRTAYDMVASVLKTKLVEEKERKLLLDELEKEMLALT